MANARVDQQFLTQCKSSGRNRKTREALVEFSSSFPTLLDAKCSGICEVCTKDEKGTLRRNQISLPRRHSLHPRQRCSSGCVDPTNCRQHLPA